MEGQVDNNNQTDSSGTDKLQALQQQLSDLQGRYAELEQNHNNYKFDIEFNRDISDVTIKPKDEELEVLKDLKLSGNEKAYNLLLEQLKSKQVTSTGSLGGFSRNYSHIKNNDEPKEYGFEEAINEIKGGN